MSDNSKRKTWPSRRRKLKWVVDSAVGRAFQTAVAGRHTRRSRMVAVMQSPLQDRWLWGEIDKMDKHSSVATEAEAKHLAEEEYHGWQKTA